MAKCKICGKCLTDGRYKYCNDCRKNDKKEKEKEYQHNYFQLKKEDKKWYKSRIKHNMKMALQKRRERIFYCTICGDNIGWRKKKYCENCAKKVIANANKKMRLKRKK